MRAAREGWKREVEKDRADRQKEVKRRRKKERPGRKVGVYRVSGV